MKQAKINKWWLLIGALVIVILLGKIFSKPIESKYPRREHKETIYRSEYQLYFDSRHSHFANLVKDRLHDPKSFEFVKSEHKDIGDDIEVIMTYRAKNGFGAIRTNRASALLNKERKTFRSLIVEMD